MIAGVDQDPRDHPRAAVEQNRVEPVPRRVRGFKDGVAVVDTLAARYVWEWPWYPQWYLPLADVRTDLLVADDDVDASSRGDAAWHTLDTGTSATPHAARVLSTSPVEGLAGTVRFEWDALDAWFEEEEQVFVHPRNPYSRSDAVRSSRHVVVSLDGVVLADSHAPVAVFETGLPTRWYLERTSVRWEHLVASDTTTACPYKGRTSAYWSVAIGGALHEDLAWSYDFPTAALLPVAGLVAFYDEKVDVTLDGVRRPRPRTHFS